MTTILNDKMATRFFENGRRLEGGVTVQRCACDTFDACCGISESIELSSGEVVLVTREGEVLTVSFTHKGQRRTWSIPIINEVPDERLSWRVDDGVPNAGSIIMRELPYGRGTEVHVVVEYLKPTDELGRELAALVDTPADEVLMDALFRLRQRLEAGEAATTEGQPVGRAQR